MTASKYRLLLSAAACTALIAIPALHTQQPAATKPATEATKAANKAVQDSLDFNNKEDFENASKASSPSQKS